jgi:hypothetical protein
MCGPVDEQGVSQPDLVADIMRKSFEGMGHPVEIYNINAVRVTFFLRKLEGRGRIRGPR